MRRYRVVGDLLVAGYAKGEEFEAEFDAFAEACLIAGGHIEVLDASPRTRREKIEKEELNG